MNKTNYRRLLSALLVALSTGIAACGTSTVPTSGLSAASPAFTGVLPAPPPKGTSRAGAIYDIELTGEVTGDTIGITVFEPTTLVGGAHYPLVLHSHGYAGSRSKTASDGGVAGTILPGNLTSVLDAGYGLISISERGSDDSTGTIRIMDPDYEGHDLLSVLDWAEANLPWLMYGPSPDGSDPHNLVVGSIGGSYGGMYQYLIRNIDPKHRLDAMIVEVAPNDLTYSLNPNDTPKALWDAFLFLTGPTAGQNLDRSHVDPYLNNFFVSGLLANQIPSDGSDFLYYHSNEYFCGTRAVAGNGEIGAAIGRAGAKVLPGFVPSPGPRVNALIWQGMRDTLFNFNDGYANWKCLNKAGGDVRLLSYQRGHNSLEVVPDIGNLLYQPSGNSLDDNCGSVNVNSATVAFFDEYLRGIPGAANKVIPTQTCISLTKGDAVLVDHVTTGSGGKPYVVQPTTVIAGSNGLPTAVDLGITIGTQGEVLAGIPHVSVDITKLVDALPGEPIVFIGLGQTHFGIPGVYDLIDNQVTPVRGVGHFDLDLVGVSERLSPGDQLVLLVYGLHDQYFATGSLNIASPAIVPVTVSGKVWLPLLGNLPNITRG